MSSTVAKRYARALFEVAKEENAVDTIEEEIRTILNAISENREFQQILSHPQNSVEKKKEIVNALLGNDVTIQTKNFINLLISRKREGILSDIVDGFVKLANELRGYADAFFTTAKPLSEDELNKLAAQFGEIVKKSLRVQSIVDPTILGGVIVRIGDRLYDGSVVGKLQRFQQNLKHLRVR